tara:strand:+ start:94 stop:450 length:357 start_codon:yes stop_codon:yes gene_type:complete
MNLNELKQMIAEEYTAYMAEQATADPKIDVDADDIGGEDAEATLKDIFDILKGYFEGGDGAGAGMVDDLDGDMGDDMGDMDDASMDSDDEEEKVDEAKKEDKEELQERFKKLANIIKG